MLKDYENLECGVEIVDVNEQEIEQLIVEMCTQWLNDEYSRD